MALKRTVLSAATLLCFTAHAEITPPYDLTVGDGFRNPLGYHDSTPRFSWKLPAGVKGQSAYQIDVSNVWKNRRVPAPPASNVWKSGWVASDQSVRVPYGGAPLASRQKINWRVRFRDEAGRESGWSELARFEMGLLSFRDWNAQWIRPQMEIRPEVEMVSWLKRDFPMVGKIERARLYVTACGVFRIRLNGQRVGNDHFATGWTSYENRIDTLTYDVTSLLREGGNSIVAMLGTGWYAGRIGWDHQQDAFDRVPELLFQLEITHADGNVITVVSDKQWQGTTNGPVASSSFYDGEVFDARRELTGGKPVVAKDVSGTVQLAPKPFAPVRAAEILMVQSMSEPEPGRHVFDLGQNMVGWGKLNIPVEKDKTVTIRFAEMLNRDGTLYTESYRTAKSTDTYTAAETGTVEWEPCFTFHGFRYVELSGLPAGANPQKEWVEGVVLHSDFSRVGKFESSHPKLNRLYSNIVWGQRGNFVDIPSDCPQRDERFGWTGDAQVFCPASMFNYDCLAFWKSWLRSMRDDQFEDGRIPHAVPDIWGKAGSPGWVDAATLIPWELYVRSGDCEVLKENFEMMEKLVGWYRRQAENGLILDIKGYGDWLQPCSDNLRGDTPQALIGTAFYARSIRVLADAARVLGRDADAARYAAEANAVERSFASHFFNAGGRLCNAPETQTGYLLPIAFDLLPEDAEKMASQHLARLVREADGHLRTGFLGTPHIARVLAENSYADLACEVLFKETYPSWFYSINQGATTLWERWNSYSHEDGFGSANMNSFNHYAYGAVGQWLVEGLAGLAPDPENPGYKHFFVRPVIADQLDWVRAELETQYGKASSEWRKEGGTLSMKVVVPPGTRATVVFPDGGDPETVGCGTWTYEVEIP